MQRATPPDAAANPIDAFIHARLAREGLKPSPEADRRTLIRRVTLDLTGLPPTPEETAAYLADKSPAAYEKAGGPPARFAALCRAAGHALARRGPLCRYLRLPRRQRIPGVAVSAITFCALSAITSHSTNSPASNWPATCCRTPPSNSESLPRTTVSTAHRPRAGCSRRSIWPSTRADRVRTTVAVWMGSTLGCAECHDHKFDPFTARDFYSMKAFFADIKETGLVPDRGAKAWGSHPHDSDSGAAEAAGGAEVPGRRRARKPRFQDGSAGAAARRVGEGTASRVTMPANLPGAWQRPTSAKSANGAVLKIYNDEEVDYNIYEGGTLASDRGPGNGLVVASGPNPDTETYTVTFKPGAGTWTALGLELVQDENLPGIRVARGADRVVITEAGGRGQWHAARRSPSARRNLGSPSAELSARRRLRRRSEDRLGRGRLQRDRQGRSLSLRFAKPVKTDDDAVMTVRIHQDSPFRRATLGPVPPGALGE